MTDAPASEEIGGFGFKPHVWARRDYLRTYIGPSWADYVGVFDEMKGSGLPAAWSWTIFFIPSVWLVYRKRYVWAVVLFLAWTVGTRMLGGPWAAGVFIAHLFFATFGKALYVRSALGAVDKILATMPDPHKRVARLNEVGGVSEKAVIVLLSLYFLYWLIAFYVAAGH